MDQITILNIPPIEKAGNRRRTRSVSRSGDGNITSRQDRIDKRNRVLVARYYYWTELKRVRFDDTLNILSDNEFFVENRTITNALVDYDSFYNKLIKDNATSRYLKKLFPGFDWS